jgi:asparagine N-glycosylation enzyme membrane subunit Stt3
MEKMFIGAVWLYAVLSQIMTLYFMWLWSHDHSFLNTITIGALVSEFKGLLFPFFL